MLASEQHLKTDVQHLQVPETWRSKTANLRVVLRGHRDLSVDNFGIKQNLLYEESSTFFQNLAKFGLQTAEI